MRQRKLNSEPLEPKYPRRGAPHRNAANRYGQDELLTVKLTLLLLVWPLASFTTTEPVVAVLGTTAVIEESLQLSTPAGAPLNVTMLCPSAAPKPDPEMFTAKPTVPDEGFRLAIVGVGNAELLTTWIMVLDVTAL